MTTILGAVAIIALLWTALSALPAGLEARMPLPYMIALTPLLWVPLMILAAVAAWQHEWTAMSVAYCGRADCQLTAHQLLGYVNRPSRQTQRIPP